MSDHFETLCIKGLKIKNYKYLTSISKFRYIDKLDDIVNEYSNTYHRTIKLNPVDIESSMYIDFNKENNKKDPKFKVGHDIRKSKHKNIFAKGYIPNWSQQVFLIKKVENTVLWAYVISDLNGEEIVHIFGLISLSFDIFISLISLSSIFIIFDVSMSLISLSFLTFSVVFPKTALIISFKKCFLKSFFAFF